MTDLRQKALNLRKEEKYSDALEFYEKIYLNHWEEADKWDIWGYVYCLKQVKLFVEAIEVCQTALARWQDFPQIKNIYAWSLYYLCLNNENDLALAQMREQTDKIVELCGDDYQYSPLFKAVISVVKHLKNHHDYEEMLSYLSKLEPVKLSKENKRFGVDNGRIVTLSSEFEQYYLMKTEALYQKGLYDQCIFEAKTALNGLTSFQNFNDIWLKRKVAKSLLATEQLQESLLIYREIITKKQEWFLYYEIAQIYHKLGNNNEALNYALEGVTKGGEIDKKVNLLALTGLLLKNISKLCEADLHYLLLIKIREKNNWSINEELAHYQVQKSQYNLIDLTIPELLKKIRTVWDKLKFESQPQYQGQISALLANNQAGFIRDSQGASYFFRVRSVKGNRDDVTQGMPVKYRLRDSFDSKKNKPTKEAVDIEIQNHLTK